MIHLKIEELKKEYIKHIKEQRKQDKRELNNIKQRIYKRKQIKEGKCIHCGKRRGEDRENKTTCKECAKKKKDIS